jgi:hypothetical protein
MRTKVNNLKNYGSIFDDITPFSGMVPEGFAVDFLGTLTDANFRTMFGVDPKTTGGATVQTQLPTMATYGEGWFEAVNWIEAARAARDRFVMVTLGACYGAQAVGSYKALQAINPMPYRLVAVEPEPDNVKWIVRHMRDNGIDPEDQWIISSAISDVNDPVLFPVGSPGSGAQNAFVTNMETARETYIKDIVSSGRAAEVLGSLLRNNSTGIKTDLAPGTDYDFKAEIKMVSAVTLKDILGPFDSIDYLESDIQQSEILVFPPFMHLLKKKVRRIHLGTHLAEAHTILSRLFENEGWEIVFDYAPNMTHRSALGDFTLNDGVLTVVNPTL